jgi:hypothetical protein
LYFLKIFLFLNKKKKGDFMVNDYMLEYLAIVDFLIENNSYYKLKSENIANDKEYIKYLMSINNNCFDFSKKLKLWKQLNLIVTEGRRFTSKITINSKREHVIIFNMKTYEILKEIQTDKKYFKSSNKFSLLKD